MGLAKVEFGAERCNQKAAKILFFRRDSVQKREKDEFVHKRGRNDFACKYS